MLGPPFEPYLKGPSRTVPLSGAYHLNIQSHHISCTLFYCLCYPGIHLKGCLQYFFIAALKPQLWGFDNAKVTAIYSHNTEKVSFFVCDCFSLGTDMVQCFADIKMLASWECTCTMQHFQELSSLNKEIPQCMWRWFCWTLKRFNYIWLHLEGASLFFASHCYVDAW